MNDVAAIRREDLRAASTGTPGWLDARDPYRDPAYLASLTDTQLTALIAEKVTPSQRNRSYRIAFALVGARRRGELALPTAFSNPSWTLLLDGGMWATARPDELTRLAALLAVRVGLPAPSRIELCEQIAAAITGGPDAPAWTIPSRRRRSQRAEEPA